MSDPPLPAREVSTIVRIRAVRHDHPTFRPRFFELHPDFLPIVRAARTFADWTDWPEPERYGDAFEGEPPVRFQAAPLKRRRPPGPIDRGALYDAMIVLRRTVPTRARMWHDFLNALVWTTFPRAKLALHRRQHAAIERWIPEGAWQLPNARTRELDALALVDEGGVLVLDDGSTPRTLHFGHALFEGLILGQPAMIARSVPLSAPSPLPTDAPSLCELADRCLAEVLDDTTRIVSPDELPRRPL